MRVQRKREPRERVRFLSAEESDALVEACKRSQNPALYVIVVLALSTGARAQELLTLTWADLDLERAQLTFQQTKNEGRRTVPVTGLALALLRDYARQEHTSRYLFPNQEGDGPADIRTAWYAARRRAGLVDFRFHDLRHSAASYLAMSGASLLDIAAILGHKTLQMTKRYAHLSDAHTASVVARMTERFLGQG